MLQQSFDYPLQTADETKAGRIDVIAFDVPDDYTVTGGEFSGRVLFHPNGVFDVMNDILEPMVPSINDVHWYDSALELLHGRTGILIAHRLSTVARAETVAVLEAGWIAFALMFATLQLHLLFQVTLGIDDPWGLAERSLQVVLWLTVACALYHRPGAAARVGLRWLRRAVAALAGLGLLVQLLANPWLTGEAVGGWPVLNLIGLGYAVPAGLLALTARALHRDGRRRTATAAFGAALLFAFVALTLEVRRAFAGTELDAVPVSDGEWYAYSVAWLAYAGVLLALALLTGQAALRYASLGLLLVATLKVFLSDMAALTGLYRALSFLGLGLVLLAIGYLYARFVFPRRPAAGSQPTG